MISEYRYIEKKSGFSDDGPAWIGRVKISKTGKTIYWGGHGFRRRNCGAGNYIDIETGDIYWISGLKRNGQDRHWAGHGKITIDRRIVPAYLQWRGESALDPSRYTAAEIADDFPIDRLTALENHHTGSDER